MAKTHGGKGSGVAQGYRTKQYEESKLWENIEKKKQDEWWQNDISEIGEVNVKAGDPLAAGQILIPTRKGKANE